MCVGLGQPIQDKFTASGTNKMVTLATQRKFREALRCAARWHAQQFRKGTKVPYIAHLLGVASLVLEDGGNTNQAIAALLHDAVEDQGGRRRYAEIRSRFGPRVAAIVKGCTDEETFLAPTQEEVPPASRARITFGTAGFAGRQAAQRSSDPR